MSHVLTEPTQEHIDEITQWVMAGCPPSVPDVATAIDSYVSACVEAAGDAPAVGIEELEELADAARGEP